MPFIIAGQWRYIFINKMTFISIEDFSWFGLDLAITLRSMSANIESQKRQNCLDWYSDLVVSLHESEGCTSLPDTLLCQQIYPSSKLIKVGNDKS